MHFQEINPMLSERESTNFREEVVETRCCCFRRRRRVTRCNTGIGHLEWELQAENNPVGVGQILTTLGNYLYFLNGALLVSSQWVWRCILLVTIIISFRVALDSTVQNEEETVFQGVSRYFDEEGDISAAYWTDEKGLEDNLSGKPGRST